MGENIILLLPEMLDIWQQTLNWQPTVKQQSLFQRLYELILAGNRLLNLTRITAPEEFWEKHLWDSLRGIAPLLHTSSGEKLRVIDIGTGAGFPGIPVAIALPHSSVTLLDSTHKKITFLNTLLSELGMENANTLTGRAEVVGKQPQHQQNYNIALIRAVGSASVCAKYALPLLQPGGMAVLYRGNWTQAETDSLQEDVEKLGGKIQSEEKFTSPISQSIRHCLYLRKNTD